MYVFRLLFRTPIRHSSLLLTVFFCVFFLSGCNSELSQIENELPTASAPPADPLLDILKNKHQLRIVTSAGINAENFSITVGDSLVFKAALYDLNDNYIEDAPVTWSTSAVFPVSDLNVSATKTTVTFTASAIGNTNISASYAGTKKTLLTDIDSTGLIQVNSNFVPALLLINSGNNQTAVVNNNLTLQLEVKLEDGFGQAIAGEEVAFSVTSGGGSILTGGPILTDASGLAGALVKIGTAAAANNQQYRATVVSDPTLFVDFQASATPGAEAHIAYSTLPTGFYQGTPFQTQPVVELQDQYNNTISNISTGTVTLSRQVGTGILLGTLVANVVNGKATYTDIGYDTSEVGVVIRATRGASTVDTGALSVLAPPPGACQADDAFFQTQDGGCKDLTTGLVWNLAAGTGTWYATVWDSELTGASAPDADDFGRTNDYDFGGVPCTPSHCDSDANTAGGVYSPVIQGQCHDLTEAGKTDWRVPTSAEFTQLGTSYTAGTPPYLAGFLLGQWYWTSTETAATSASRQRLGPDSAVSAGKNSIYKFVCVREGRKASDRLAVSTTLADISKGLIPTGILAVKIKDEDGISVNAAGVTLTLAATNLGTLGGTTTAITDNTGKATFDSFTLDTTGTATVTITAPGLTSVDSVVEVRDGKHLCVLNDGSFTTMEGGCKDLLTNLVWSYSSVTNWMDAIWDSALPGNAAPEPWEVALGKTDEYLTPGPLRPDDSLVNYCHELTEMGYTDWRMATHGDMIVSRANGAMTHFLFPFGTGYHWTTTTQSATAAGVYQYVNTGYSSADKVSGAYVTICVREGTP